MQKDQILRLAISKNLSQKMIEDKTSFAVVRQSICSVDNMKMSEEEKKEELVKRFQNFWRGNSRLIANCKREHVRNIVKYAFGIRSAENSDLSEELKSLNFQELFLYYCYIQRIAVVDEVFSKVLWDENSKKSSESFARRREAEQKEKEQKENEDKKILEAMTKEKRWEYEIVEKHMDMEYFQKLNKEDVFSDEDQVVIAEILRNYWIATQKWEGGKINKKQINRIKKIKEILRID